MGRAEKTEAKLLDAATALFWNRGFSNVPLRDVSKAAGVDVALVSRYFGSKRGLFAATLNTAFDWPELLAADDPSVVAIAKYAAPDAGAADTAAVRMIVMNAADPEVGDLVREGLQVKLLKPLQDKMGGGEGAAQRLALFIAVILGASMARQSLQLPGVADVPPETYAAQLRQLVDAALTFEAD